jgi:integrase/recombinase XerD
LAWTVVGADHLPVVPVDRFLAHMTAIGRSPQSVRSYAFDLRDFFTFLDQAAIVWTELRLEDFGRFVAWLRLSPDLRSSNVSVLRAGAAGGCSATTVNRKLSAVTSFYEFHRRHGVHCGDALVTLRPSGSRGSWRPFLAHLGSDGRRRTIKLVPERRIPRALPPAAVATVLAACERLRDRLLIGVLAWTGMRIGEALGLRHEDIDSAGRQVQVRSRLNANGARAKTGPRTIPVPPTLIRLYTDYLVDEYGDLDSDYVFVNLWGGQVGVAWQYGNAAETIRRLSRQTQIPFTAHSLRHTYATDLLRRGLPAEMVQKLLGHASVSTTIDTYAHLGVDDVRRCLERVGWLPGVTEVAGP